MKIKLFLFFGAAIVGFALASTPATAQVVFNGSTKYDDGIEPALAAHPSGLVLEFHRSSSAAPILGGDTLWYHVGRIKGTTIAWSASQRAPGTGSWPNVAITQDGFVLYVWSGSETKSESSLYYEVGKIDLNHDENQSIRWLTSGKTFDAGFHSSLAMNDSGVIVEAHESGTGGRGMYYRVGHLADPAVGRYNLIWNSGSYGRYYDDGTNPHLAINNLNQVVEVHQADGNVFYHRGQVLSDGTIYLRGSHNYDYSSAYPMVALLDNGLVVEIHKGDRTQMICSPGQLTTDPEIIYWYRRFDAPTLTEGYGALTTDGTSPGPRVAVGSWGYAGSLNYTVATVDGQ